MQEICNITCFTLRVTEQKVDAEALLYLTPHLIEKLVDSVGDQAKLQERIKILKAVNCLFYFNLLKILIFSFA